MYDINETYTGTCKFPEVFHSAEEEFFLLVYLLSLSAILIHLKVFG